jgi:septal ring factor EnvC (AmiA/AmiB activator)
MNKLFMMMIACVSLILCTIQVQAAEEKNPFASYFSKIARNEKKIKKMDKSKDAKKIKAMKERIAKDKKKLEKAVETKTVAIDKKIAKLEDQLEKVREAGKDLNPINKKIHKLYNESDKIRAWSKNEKLPELEEFVPEGAEKK